jgi:hypothetical protein
VKLLPRRNPDPSAVDLPDEDFDDSGVNLGKGRPTPKRRESTLQRGPVTAPKTRKEAAARQREQVKTAKSARRASSSGTTMTAQQRREALRAGDPSMLPRRDQGRTRKLARDYVDSHRMISNYLLALFPLMIVSYLIPQLQFVVLATLLVLIIEWNLTGRRIRKLATERFGSAEGSAMSLGFYAGSRAYLPRRWRLPAPQVDLGDTI